MIRGSPRTLSRAGLLLSLALICTPFPSAGAEDEEPVLWTGVVKTPGGQPLPGATVSAYARPPADQLTEGSELTRIARTAADGSGRFTLRAAPDGVAAGLADESGWVTVMVTATSAGGMTMAVDSLAWKPAGGFKAQSVSEAMHGPGRWVTSPAQLFAPDDRFSATAADSGAADPSEHPDTLTVTPTGGFRPLAKSAHDGCGMTKKKEIPGVQLVTVGELFLRPGWGGQFAYNTTKSTSFQIGVKEEGKGWSAGGSVSMSKQHKMTNGAPLASKETIQWYEWRIAMKWHEFRWICGEGTVGYLYYETTIEPTDWTGDMQRLERQEEPACSPNADHRIHVGPNGGYFDRETGSSTTYDTAIQVGGFAGSTTAAISNGVSTHWTNNAPRERIICPSSDYIYKNTQITTLP